VRQHADEVRPLLELGSAAARGHRHAERTQLRELSAAQRRGPGPGAAGPTPGRGRQAARLRGRGSWSRGDLERSTGRPGPGRAAAAGSALGSAEALRLRTCRRVITGDRKPPAAPAKAKTAPGVASRPRPSGGGPSDGTGSSRSWRRHGLRPRRRRCRSAAEQRAKQAADEAKAFVAGWTICAASWAAAEEELARATAASDQAAEERDAAAAAA
jgi:hypothetical protein